MPPELSVGVGLTGGVGVGLGFFAVAIAYPIATPVDNNNIFFSMVFFFTLYVMN